MTPRRRSSATRHLPDNLYARGASYRYRHPVTRQFFGMGSDEAMAIAAARKLNARLKPQQDLSARVSNALLFGEVLKRYQAEYLPTKNLKPGTLKSAGYRLNTLAADLGGVAVGDLSVMYLSAYLDETFTGDPYIKHRGQLIDICRWAITKGLIDGNPAEQTLAKNSAEKQRLPMTLEQFHAIRSNAQPWLQNAMDLALISLQRRGDLCKMRYEDIRDGRLFVVQEKTEKHGVRAHLSIEMSAQLEGLIARTRADDVISPFVIHERPQRVRESTQKQHWSQVLPDRLTKQLAKARDALPQFASMPAAQRPGLHEIRSLGGWLYLDQGYSKEYVNLLMGHTTMAMTEHYTDRHIEWTTCRAELKI